MKMNKGGVEGLVEGREEEGQQQRFDEREGLVENTGSSAQALLRVMLGAV